MSLCKYRLKLLSLTEEHVKSSSLQSAGFTLGAVGSQKMKRWEADYVLEELDKLHLFDEYIEMSEWNTELIFSVFAQNEVF